MYYSVLNEKESEIKIEKSRFIGNSSKIDNEDQAKEYIKKISDRYKNATHNCWAYKIGDIQNYSDNGEPNGTAGKPMIGIINKYKLDRIVCVSTRYFGGIKLGIRGLIDAYSEITEVTVKNCKIVFYENYDFYSVVANYSKYSEIEKLLKREEKWEITDIKFTDTVSFKIRVNSDNKEKIMEILNLKSEKTEYLFSKEFA